MVYDVIIAGGSFAGLAVATQLRGWRVLILDRKPIGTGQTSACGTILPVLEHWHAEASVLQVHHSLFLHTADRDIEFKSPYPWCTFDYARLCHTLLGQTGAEVCQAAVTGLTGRIVHTTAGDFEGRCLVDASGWRAALASALQPGFAHQGVMSFGLETICPYQAEGLHFWYTPAIVRHGVTWLFPRGQTSSIGIGSYRGATKLREPLADFLREFSLEPDGLHGTYFPSRLRPPTAGHVFVVGDAAGHCLGLTGEGIRPALYFGEACGRTVERVLDGVLTLAQGLKEYADFVHAHAPFYRLMSGAQWLLTRLPPGWITPLALAIGWDKLRQAVMNVYWHSIRPAPGCPTATLGYTRRWSSHRAGR